MNILLVEDNLGDARLLREMFNEPFPFNAKVTHVTSMGHAERHAAEHEIDVIVLDLGLPDAQGLDAVRRSRMAALHVPLVVLTGSDSQTLATQALQEGAQDYLVKGQIEARGLQRALLLAVEREAHQRELERSNGDLEQFAYAASHDLKAPLRAISHLVQWIDEDVRATASQDTLENLDLLKGRTARLYKLLDGLLAYSRIGRNSAMVEDVDIAEEVQNIVDMLQLPSGFTVVCNGEMPVIPTYRVPIQMILKNLISNALQHHDLTQGCIAVTVQLSDGVAEFRVSDDGPGIPEQFHARVFEIFQTLLSRDEIESSGIGLAIVKKQIMENGGRIWIERTHPDRGATFVFTWRVSEPARRTH